MRKSYNACPDCGNPKRTVAVKCRSCAYAVGAERCCTSCKEVKPTSDFRIRTRATPKPRSVCKMCESQQALHREQQKPLEVRNAAKRRWDAANPEKVAEGNLRRRIKVLLPDPADQSQAYHAVKTETICAICGRHRSVVGTLHIDHDHSTGKFRGMLCSTCNTGLGQFADDVSRLQKAVEYLSLTA